ncbi:glutamate receptor-interacting protein 1-like isoform X2 [Dendronephthya gigantea]|uniref:glutamate receptor-interacting protein 1-like isoform X2 n=1 Tax=Dendronephthya gigantea TaxID=151771 RepID=UPI00106AFA2F|nr:glutamate receptor-interacting protein 1-like isoform X2 [Dendronephthya gigantea]
MTSIFSRVKSKIVKNDKNMNKDGALNSANSNHEPKDSTTGILIVKLVKTKHDKGLGLTVSGGIDRGSNHPVISHLRLGGIADKSESLVIGDIILAVNNKKTENLTHQEVVDLLRNAGQHVHLKIQYKIPTPDTNISSSCKTAIIQLKKEADGFGIVARESPQTSIHGYRPLVVASVRPGSAAQSRGVVHVGDRLLAINGQALLGLSREDVVLLLKHAHDQVSLQIEYDVYHKEPMSTQNGTWIIDIEKPAPAVSLGLILEDRSGVIVISDINEGGVADRLGVFHKEDQIISINATYVKDLSLAGVVDLLAKSGSRVKIEFLTVHALNKDEENTAMSDRYGKVDSWVCSHGEFSDDQLSESTAHDELLIQDRRLHDNDPRERLRRALPQAPSGDFAGYDNTRRALTNDSSPYEEISEVIANSRGNVDLQSEPGSDQRSRNRMTEGLYSKVRKPRSNSVGASTGRTSPWSGAGYRGLGSRRSSFSNAANSESYLRGRRQFSSRNNNFWSSRSLKCSANAQLCRQEYVEVNLTADNQGFGLTIAESYIGRQSVLVIAEIESGGPAERSGVLQINDEVLGINDTDVGMMTAEHCNGILQSFGTHANILIGFTVAESIVASSGTFSVKLPKHYFGLGITFTELNNADKTCIIISHVRKGSLAYRTGILHLGDQLLAINGHKMACVEDSITFIDAVPLGEIVSVTVQKEQEIEDESSGVVYTIELSKQGRSTVGIVITGGEVPGNGNILVTSLVPGTVAERSGAVHVGDRILAVNDILVKNKPVKEVYQMLDFSGEFVKLRLQSVDTRKTKQPSVETPARGLEIPDMSSLHRVSAWAEIFNELDQIVAVSKPSGAKKEPETKTEAAKNVGITRKIPESNTKTGNEGAESEITATVSEEVKSGNDEFWEQFGELWESEKNRTEEQTTTNATRTDEIRSFAAPTSNESTDTGIKTHDSSSGTLNGKAISIRYVVHEKCVNPAQVTHERTTQRSCVYLRQDSRGKLSCDNPKTQFSTKPYETSTCSDSRNRSRENLTNDSGSAQESRERKSLVESTDESPQKTRQNTGSLERSPSVASGYETDSTLQNSVNDLPHCDQRGDTEPFTSMDSFDISNDADDKLLPPTTKVGNVDSTSDVLETRTFSVEKSGQHGFGFSLMPDKFKQEVYIASVLPGGPCDGMLQPLDKITKIDDKDLTQLNIYEIIQILQHGPAIIKLCVVRNPFNTYVDYFILILRNQMLPSLRGVRASEDECIQKTKI